jgi:hypothetical protein
MIDGKHLVVSGGSQQGWSGGPVIDSQGRVVAILHATDGQQTYATPLAVYRRLFWRVVPLWRGGDADPPGPTGPTQPPQPDLAAVLAKIEALQAEVATLRAALEVLKIEPIVGPAGAQGPRGPPGDPASVDLDELTALILERLPPLSFQATYLDGTPAGEPVSKRLGETVLMKSYPGVCCQSRRHDAGWPAVDGDQRQRQRANETHVP